MTELKKAVLKLLLVIALFFFSALIVQYCFNVVADSDVLSYGQAICLLILCELLIKGGIKLKDNDE